MTIERLIDIWQPRLGEIPLGAMVAEMTRVLDRDPFTGETRLCARPLLRAQRMIDDAQLAVPIAILFAAEVEQNGL